MLLHLSANCSNDAFDTWSGADSPEDPQRLVAQGRIRPSAMLYTAGACIILALIPGFLLMWTFGWPILLLGLAGILCAILYTGGPFPLAYKGLGDPLVLFCIGGLCTIGAAWVQAPALFPGPPIWWWHAAALGSYATLILAVNNQRDYRGDQGAGKRTLAVRLGPQKHSFYLFFLHGLGFYCFAMAAAWAWLPLLLFFPLALLHATIIAVYKPEQLSVAVAGGALLQFAAACILIGTRPELLTAGKSLFACSMTVAGIAKP